MARNPIVAMALEGQSEEHCKHLIQKTVGEFGGIQILVNNATLQIARQNRRMAEPGFERCLGTCLGHVLSLKAAMPRMQPGSVVIWRSDRSNWRADAALTRTL